MRRTAIGRRSADAKPQSVPADHGQVVWPFTAPFGRVKHMRPRRWRSRLVVLATMAAALLAVGGCRSASTQPAVVVDPQRSGQWVSEEVNGSSLQITLGSGEQVSIDTSRTQLGLSNGGGRKAGTLIMYGMGPATDCRRQRR